MRIRDNGNDTTTTTTTTTTMTTATETMTTTTTRQSEAEKKGNRFFAAWPLFQERSVRSAFFPNQTAYVPF